MAFVEDELIFNTPGVIQKLTEPNPYRFVYEESVVYKQYDGEDEASSGLMVDDIFFAVPKNELTTDEDKKTVEFDFMENSYIIRPIQEDDSKFFDANYLKELQEDGN
jgi:hypothetical protein